MTEWNTTFSITLPDEQALADFETLVLSQQPASVPWQPVLDYPFEERKRVEGNHPRLILDTFHPQRLLDVGCGVGGYLIRLLEEEQPTWAHAFAGFDPQVAWHAPWPLFRGDILTVSILSAPYHEHELQARDYDLVICREVLEHLTLRQIRKAVTNLCALSSRFVYVTTRFNPAPQHLLSVATSDTLDPTHITLTHQPFLRMLFVLEGFRRCADLEAKMDHKGYGRVLVYERAI